MYTKPSYRIGRPSEEYSLLAFISKEGSEKLAPILSSLETTFPGSIYSLKHGQLHITVTAVMRDITYGDATREEFLRNEKAIIGGISKVLKNYASYSIHFNEVKATQDALIITSPDSDTLNKLRSDIIHELAIPYPPSAIAHSSIARFRSEVNLEDINSRLTDFDIGFTERISELCLVRETVMPLEKYEVIATFQLAPL